MTPVRAADLLPTYEVRLEASATGSEPRTRGLQEFVEALRGSDIAAMFAVCEGGTTAIGLVTDRGRIVAVTMVLGSGPA